MVDSKSAKQTGTGEKIGEEQRGAGLMREAQWPWDGHDNS